MTSSAEPRLVGSVLGERYELVRPLVQDGLSDLFEGKDLVLERRVAVQLFRPSESMDRAAFDGHVASLLDDPAVQVYDAGEWSDDGGYVVVELTEQATPIGVVVGDRSVGGDDPTTVVAVGGDTAVMPAVLQPAAAPVEEPADRTPSWAAAGANRALWLALAAIALVVVLLASQGGGGIDAPTPTTTEPVAITTPPPTTAPPTTAAPPVESPGKGKGRGNKRDD